MKRTWKTMVGRVLIITLASAVMNLFQSCATYRLREKEFSGAGIERSEAAGKYLILYNLSGVYNLTGIQIRHDTLFATASELSAEHRPYIILAGEKPPACTYKKNRVIDQEVILTIPVEITGYGARISIPVSSVTKAKLYKRNLSNGTYALLTIGGLGAITLFVAALASLGSAGK